MKYLLYLLILATCLPIYSQKIANNNAEVSDLVGKMTIEEKVRLTYGDFFSGGIPRLGIDKMLVMDGPVGIRLNCIQRSRYFIGEEVQTGAAYIEGLPEITSALPSTLSLAASWDHSAAYQYASIIADEMLAINAHVLLGPGINLMRDPRGGRNFEYMGEDTYLTAELAIQYVLGLQNKSVGANLKHYVGNENDELRHLTSSRIDEKTLREIYVYPFERAIREADAWSIMTGNNLLNDVYMGNNTYAIKEILRGQVGFDGVVLTDWRSAYKALPSLEATVDMTTGFCSYVYENHLLELVKSGKVKEETINEMAFRILKLYYRTGVINSVQRGEGAVNTADSQKRIREITANSMVLLKNDNNLLPIDKSVEIIVTGPGAENTISGGGSSVVNVGVKRQTILEGLKNAFGENVTYIPNPDDAKIEGQVVVYCALGLPGSEDHDMPNILLPDNQDKEIIQLGERTDKLVVLLQNSTSVDVSRWGGFADAILLTWLGGQSFGDAVADIVSGKVNPSGRLPFTFGNSIEDYPCAMAKTWPAMPVNDNPYTKPGREISDRDITFEKAPQFIMNYKEKGLIGYRGFLANNIDPIYPFGYGISYTTFEISNIDIKAEGMDYLIACQVLNTGKRAGSNVLQAYIKGPDDKVKKLRGFTKISLLPGESMLVSLKIRGNDLANFDTINKKWLAQKGEYLIELTDESVLAPKWETFINIEEDRVFMAP